MAMKLSTPRYSICLLFQFTFLLCDLIFNCISLFPKSRDALLVLFIFQDLFLVLSVTLMLMTFFSTYLFQVAGLVSAGVRGARGACIGCASYVCVTLALHALWAGERGAGERAEASSAAVVVLLTVQRCLSPWYYFFYKRAALRVSDPRFYEDIDWINRQLHTR